MAARKRAKSESPESSGDSHIKPGIVTQVFDRVRQIKMKHPEVSRRVDSHESEIRDKLMAIKDCIDEFPKVEKELVTVLVINGIHKMCDEILIDSEEEAVE